MLECGATKSQVDHCVRWLKKNQICATVKATRGFVVTVLNYELYQSIDTYKSDSRGDSKATQKRQDSKEGNNEIHSRTSDEVRLSELLLNLILERKSNFREGQPERRDKTIQRWAIHIYRLIRLDKRTPERVEKVIQWTQADDFWRDNILSTKKLRQQIDQLELKMDKSEPNLPVREIKRGPDGKTARERIKSQIEAEDAERKRQYEQ